MNHLLALNLDDDALDRGLHPAEEGSRVHPDPHDEEENGDQDDPLVPGQISEVGVLRVDDGTEEDSPEHGKHVPGRPDDPRHCDNGVHRMHPEDPQQDQKFPHEPVEPRQADRREGHQEQGPTKQRDPPEEPAKVGDHPGVAPLVDHPDQEEQGPGGEAVVNHLEYRSGDPLLV